MYEKALVAPIFNLILYLGEETQKPGQLKLTNGCSCLQITELGYNTYYVKGCKKIRHLYD